MNEDKIRKQLELYLRNNNKNLKNAIEVIKEKYEKGLLTGIFEIPTAEGSKYIFEYNDGLICECHSKYSGIKVILDEPRKINNVDLFTDMTILDSFYEHYPLEFEELLQTLKNGQVVTFNNGITYAVAVTKKKLLIKPVYENKNVDKIEINKFLEKTTLTCDLTRIRESEYKSLYKDLTQCKILNSSLRYTTKIDMDKKIKQLEKKLKKSETHSLLVGNNRFYVRHSLIGPLWYDASGERINRKLLTYILSWAETAPVLYEIYEKDPVKSDILRNEEFIQDIEDLACMNKFNELYEYIAENLPEENGFELNIKSIQKDNDDYKKVKFVFKKENNKLFCFKCVVNDIYVEEKNGKKTIKEITDIKQIDVGVFREFLEKKYMQNHLSIQKIRADKEALLQKEESPYLESSINAIDDRLITKECIEEIDDDLTSLLNAYQADENKENDFVKAKGYIKISEDSKHFDMEEL